MQTYQSMGYTVFEMFRERYTLSGLFHSFVGAFGSMSIYGSIWLYRAYKVFFAAGIVGALLYLIRYKKRRKISGREWFFHINMLYCIFMPVFLTIYYAYTTDYQNQGRYLLPALIPLMYYMTKGIQKLSEISFRGRTFPRWLVNAGIAVMLPDHYRRHNRNGIYTGTSRVFRDRTGTGIVPVLSLYGNDSEKSEEAILRMELGIVFFNSLFRIIFGKIS